MHRETKSKIRELKKIRSSSTEGGGKEMQEKQKLVKTTADTVFKVGGGIKQSNLEKKEEKG